MKPRADPVDAQAWLTRAKSNLRLAELGRKEGVLLEDLCFEAQQAAEKALKAVCVHYSIEFPRTHSLVLLMDLIESAGAQLTPDVKSAGILTQYAVEARYPGWGEDATQ